MPTLLLELFSEEIPSRMQRGACEQLQRLVTAGFAKAGLAHGEVKTFVSPRHLAVQVFGLPLVQPDVSEERKGPKVGAPEQAMKGFLNAVGLTAEQCEQRDGYYFARIEKKGRPASAVAQEVCEAALHDFVWPKSMQWGDSKARPMRWVRPLHRIVALLDSTVIPVQFGHLTADNTTCGHRFMAPDAFAITHAESYVEQMRAAHVLVDYDARRAQISDAIAALAQQHGLTLVPDAGLLDEVTGLVEHPVPLIGTFDASFLQLPPEVLVSEMKVHQRYFALRDASGTLTNRFITVANIAMDDAMRTTIAEGNGRVLRARLSDGAFYWEQDKKTSLEQWGKKLADVVFHAKVGMMNEKVARIEQLAAQLANQVQFSDTAAVGRAALLCKADLTSGMVGEFPDLQGIMGRYYATAQGEASAVCEAIYEHYKPQGANDSVPATALGSIIAVADKLDSITSLFAAGEKPTGSKDPFALRRAALGVLRIVLDQQWNIDLAVLLTPEVVEFFRERLKTMLRDEGVRHDIIDASFAAGDGSFNPLSIVANARALSDFTTQQQTALTAIKRALSILAAEEKKAKTNYRWDSANQLAIAELDTTHTIKPAEKALFDSVKLLELQLKSSTYSDHYSQSKLTLLENLTAPINRFFDDVLVTEEGFKDARLSLLAGVRETTSKIADFSKIEG